MKKQTKKRPARKPRAQFAAGKIDLKQAVAEMRDAISVLFTFRDEQGRRIKKEPEGNALRALKAAGEQERKPGDVEPRPDRVPPAKDLPLGFATAEQIRRLNADADRCAYFLKEPTAEPWAAQAAAPHVFTNLRAAVQAAREAIGAITQAITTDTAARMVHATELLAEAAIHTDNCGRGHQRATQHYREELRATRGLLRDMSQNLNTARREANAARELKQKSDERGIEKDRQIVALRIANEQGAVEINRLRCAIREARSRGNDTDHARNLRSIKLTPDE